jgi:hypothetical protein
MLRELQKAATFMPARKFVEEHADELAQLPKAQPYINGILTGKSNDQIRAAYTALAVVVRMDLDDLLKSAKPISGRATPEPVRIGENVRIKLIPAQPGDRQINQEERRNFRKAIGLIKEVNAKLKEEEQPKSRKERRAAKAAEAAQAKEIAPRPELNYAKGIVPEAYTPSATINVKPVHMGTVQQKQAIEAFFVDVRRMIGGNIGAVANTGDRDTVLGQRRNSKAKVDDTNALLTEYRKARRQMICQTREKGGIDARVIVETHSELLSSHAGTTRYMLQYRRCQINAYQMIEAARRVFMDLLGVPLADKVDVRDWTRRTIPGAVTTEKLLAYEDAKRYVVNMTALGLTIQDPIVYEIRDILREEAKASGVYTKSTKTGARSGKGKSLASMLQEAVFGKGLVGSAEDIDKLINGSNKSNQNHSEG